MFWAETWKNVRFFLSENFQFWVVKFSIYLKRCVFPLGWLGCKSATQTNARDLGFRSRWKQKSDCPALHCTETFFITLPLFRYDLNNVERDIQSSKSPSDLFPQNQGPVLSAAVLFKDTSCIKCINVTISKNITIYIEFIWLFWSITEK